MYTDADHASKLHGLRVVLCGDKMDSEVLELNSVANVVTNISGVEVLFTTFLTHFISGYDCPILIIQCHCREQYLISIHQLLVL